MAVIIIVITIVIDLLKMTCSGLIREGKHVLRRGASVPTGLAPLLISTLEYLRLIDCLLIHMKEILMDSTMSTNTGCTSGSVATE